MLKWLPTMKKFAMLLPIALALCLTGCATIARNAYWNGYFACKAGNFETAIKQYNKSINLDPAAYVYYYRGLAYLAAGKPINAKADFEKALSMAGPNSGFDKAIKIGLSLIDAHLPGICIEDYIIGVDYFEKGDHEDAVRSLTDMVNRAPDFSEAKKYLALAESKRNQIAKQDSRPAAPVAVADAKKPVAAVPKPVEKTPSAASVAAKPQSQPSAPAAASTSGEYVKVRDGIYRVSLDIPFKDTIAGKIKPDSDLIFISKVYVGDIRIEVPDWPTLAVDKDGHRFIFMSNDRTFIPKKGETLYAAWQFISNDEAEKKATGEYKLMFIMARGLNGLHGVGVDIPLQPVVIAYARSEEEILNKTQARKK
jgi:tetratricopeptide (TPR) repeat protein